MPHRLFASNSVVDYVANVFETVHMHCKLFLTHSYQNDLPSKFNYGHWIGNVVLELDRVGLLLALLLLFLGALCVFSWPSGRINNGAEKFRRGTLFRWKMNRASIFSLVGFALVNSVSAVAVDVAFSAIASNDSRGCGVRDDSGGGARLLGSCVVQMGCGGASSRID